MRIINKVFSIIVIAICLYAVVLIVSDFSKLRDHLTNFKMDYLPLILLIVPTSWVALFVRWHLLLRNLGVKIPIKSNAAVYFSGFALAITPGKLGELVKCQIMKDKFDIPRSTTAPLVIVERLYDLVGAVAVAIIGIWALGLGQYIIIFSALILVFIFTLFRSQKFFKKFLSIFDRFKFIAKFTNQFSESHETIQKSTSGKIIITSSILTTIYWSVEAIGVYLVVISFGIDSLGYLDVLATYVSSLILGAASLIPGGIGVAEGSMAGLFNYQGIKLSSAIMLVILIRFFTIWYSVFVGFVALKLSGGFSIFFNSEK